MRTYRTVAKAVPRQSCTDVSEAVAMASVPKLWTHRKSSYGCAVPKMCGRVGGGTYGFSMPKPCGRFETVAKAVPRQSCTDVSEAVAMASVPKLRTHRKSSYGCAVPKMCGRVGGGTYGFSVLKPCGRIETVAKAVPRQSCTDVSEAVAMASVPKLRTYRKSSYGCAVPKMCGRVGGGTYGFSVPKPCVVSRR